MSHLAINWILIHRRATNQDSDLIAVMLPEEQSKRARILELGKRTREKWGRGKLEVNMHNRTVNSSFSTHLKRNPMYTQTTRQHVKLEMATSRQGGGGIICTVLQMHVTNMAER